MARSSEIEIPKDFSRDIFRRVMRHYHLDPGAHATEQQRDATLMKFARTPFEAHPVTRESMAGVRPAGSSIVETVCKGTRRI
jgi:hypothetical protein